MGKPWEATGKSKGKGQIVKYQRKGGGWAESLLPETGHYAQVLTMRFNHLGYDFGGKERWQKFVADALRDGVQVRTRGRDHESSGVQHSSKDIKQNRQLTIKGPTPQTVFKLYKRLMRLGREHGLIDLDEFDALVPVCFSTATGMCSILDDGDSSPTNALPKMHISLVSVSGL